MKLGKQTIVFLAVNKNGDEVILDNFPVRQGEVWTDERSAHDEEYFSVEDHNSAIVLPKGSIYKLTGKYLTWEDAPVSLTLIMARRSHLPERNTRMGTMSWRTISYVSMAWPMISRYIIPTINNATCARIYLMVLNIS